MTLEELLEVAKRKGFVEWERSKKVEMLFKGNRGAKNICALNVITKKAHIIHPRERYHCREITSTEMVRLGQLV